jgi:hypothetical protein
VGNKHVITVSISGWRDWTADTFLKTIDYDLRTSLSGRARFDCFAACNWKESEKVVRDSVLSFEFLDFLYLNPSSSADVNPSIKLHNHKAFHLGIKGHARQWEMMWINGLIKTLCAPQCLQSTCAPQMNLSEHNSLDWAINFSSDIMFNVWNFDCWTPKK